MTKKLNKGKGEGKKGKNKNKKNQGGGGGGGGAVLHQPTAVGARATEHMSQQVIGMFSLSLSLSALKQRNERERTV